MTKTTKVHDFLTQAKALYHLPLLDLISQAHQIHRAHHDLKDIQRCSLLSIKTGGCQEDCGYCSQSAHHHNTGVERQPLMSVEMVTAAAKKAKADGAQRFCMGAAWRSVKNGGDFEQVLEMVRVVKAQGLEVCVTLGMLTEDQARRLKEAGLDAYNHNLDTSREYYDKVIHTRTYDDRLDTLHAVRQAGINVCSGGIIGMGESAVDRCSMLAELAGLDPQPESVPINLLMSVKGTPLENQPPIDPAELVRTVAVARILMPDSRVKLSAGRVSMSKETQILAFFAGANAIFLGEKLLTGKNPDPTEDQRFLDSITNPI